MLDTRKNDLLVRLRNPSELRTFELTQHAADVIEALTDCYVCLESYHTNFKIRTDVGERVVGRVKELTKQRRKR